MYCVDSICRNDEVIYFLNIPAKNTSAPIVVLLHGFPDNAFGWDLQIEALKERFHIVAPFMPGTLNEKKVLKKRITGDELKEDLKTIISQVKKSSSQKVYFISHDLGCFLSVLFVKEKTSDVCGLIHINGLGLEQFISRKWGLTQWLKSSYVLFIQNSLLRYIVSELMPKYILNIVYNLSLVRKDDRIRHNDKKVLSSIFIYKHLFRRSFDYLGKKIQKISSPTLFIWGNNDIFLNIPNMDEVEKFYTQGTVRILEGGHWVMRTRPDHVNRILLKTLNQWEAST